MLKNITYITRADQHTGIMEAPDGKRKIFISYRHSDEQQLPLCRKLAQLILQKHDVAVWYDTQLTAGEEYDTEIQRAIRNADAFVLLLTPEILDSKYILEQEIPFAQKNQVSIIPVIAGLADKDILKVEAVLGRVHMPTWFFNKRDTVPEFPKDALEQFQKGLSISIANKDLLSQVQLFYQRGNNKTSVRYLSFEQIFMKAYGCLFGIGEEQDKRRGVKLMETILGDYSDDNEFLDLQKQVAKELLTHFYRSNQPELFIAYIKPLLEKGFRELIPLLFDAYRNQWHPELFMKDAAISIAYFKYLSDEKLPSPVDLDDLATQIAMSEPTQPVYADPHPWFPKIGELHTGDGTVYFQKAATTDSRDRVVSLFKDGILLDSHQISLGYGDVTFLFLAYDPIRDLILSLEFDFDHYGPDTFMTGKAFRAEATGVRTVRFVYDARKLMHQLPYSPYTFGFTV